MTWTRLVMREMLYSRWNTLACLAVISAAAGLFVAVMDIGASSVDATRLLMRDMGFNLQITAAAADSARWQALDFSGPDMPEDYIQRLAQQRQIMAQHFVGKLQQTMQAEGCTIVLTGVLPETVRTGTEKTPMPTAYAVPEGQVFLGAAVARATGKGAGDTFQILSKTFVVGRVLDEYGAIPEDIRVNATLPEVQALLNRPGRINTIDALACQCPANVTDIVGMVRKSIEDVLPDIAVQPYYSILLARHEQRVMMRRIQMAVLAAALAAAAAAVWGLTYQNVVSRRQEIGVLRALGMREEMILVAFLTKIAAYAVAGAAAGCLLGRLFFLYTHVAPPALLTPPSTMAVLIIATPMLAIIFGLPPVLSRLLRDPVDTLGEGAP